MTLIGSYGTSFCSGTRFSLCSLRRNSPSRMALSLCSVLLHAEKLKDPSKGAFSYWLPVEDYLQTSHGLVVPADLIAA